MVFFFLDGDGFNVSGVRGERVPEARGRVAEGSSPHGGQIEREDGDVDSGDPRDREGMLMWTRLDAYGGVRLRMVLNV